MSLGAYDRPCNLVGAIRIDDGDDVGFRKDIRSRVPCTYSRASINDKKMVLVDCADHNEGEADSTIHQELAKADEQITTEQESCWDPQQAILMKDIVLSCSKPEVQRCLDIYLQAQAHQQLSRFKDELLEHVQKFRLTGHS